MQQASALRRAGAEKVTEGDIQADYAGAVA